MRRQITRLQFVAFCGERCIVRVETKSQKSKTHSMKLTKKSSVSMIALALGALFSLADISLSRAADDNKKADPAGTWTWTTPGRNGGADRKMTLKLKVEGEKVTGTLSSPGQDGETVKN